MALRYSSTRCAARIGALALVVAMVVVGAPAGSQAPPPPVGLLPVPSPLPAGDPGDVIASQDYPVAGFPYTVEAHQIVYLSTDRFGDPVAVSGTVVVPVGVPAPPGGRAAVAWGHGTTGIGDGCAPSVRAQSGSGPTAPHASNSFAPYLDAGHVVVATDYPGIGTPGLNPYLDGVGAGRSLLDSLRAAQTFGATTTSAVAGFSQGGHATVYAGTEWTAGYASDLDLRAVVPVAAPTFLSAAYAAAGALPAARSYVRLILAGIVVARPDLDVSQLLTPSGIAVLDAARAEDAAGGCPYPDFDLDADVRADPLSLPAWRAALQENEPGAHRIAAPVLMVAGETDTTSFLAMTDTICTGLQERGTDLRLWMYDGGHSDEPFADRARWTLDRLAGAPLTDAVAFTDEVPDVITSCPFGVSTPVDPTGTPADPPAEGATPIPTDARLTG